jgi:hypothetical protein
MNRVYATPLPIRSLAQLLYKSEYISQLQCAVRAWAPNGHHLDLRVVHGEHLRISRFLPDAVKVHRPQNESECR